MDTTAEARPTIDQRVALARARTDAEFVAARLDLAALGVSAGRAADAGAASIDLELGDDDGAPVAGVRLLEELALAGYTVVPIDDLNDLARRIWMMPFASDLLAFTSPSALDAGTLMVRPVDLAAVLDSLEARLRSHLDEDGLRNATLEMLERQRDAVRSFLGIDGGER